MEMSAETRALFARALETQEEFRKTLLALNEAPGVATPIVRGIEDQGTQAPSRYVTLADRMALRASLRKMTDNEVFAVFAAQARERNSGGVPLDQWLNTAGYAAQVAWEGIHSQVTPEISKALDSVAGGALIRQDLEPMLYEVYVRQFPAYERFPKEPANGLTHAWNQITGYGSAKFMAELGTVTDDTSTYVRKTTNVAILATRRGISLKSRFAVTAGGMGYNPEQLELTAGLRAMAHTMQQAIFGGQSTETGGTADNEFGLYDENGITGLRSTLNTGSAVNLDPATNPTTTGNFRNAVNSALLPVSQSGGRSSIIWGHPQEKITFDQQQDPNVRILAPDLVNIGVGVVAERFNTIEGPLPFAIVPGDSIADYHTGAGVHVRDMYVLQEDSITLPYLGSEGPTVLDIPIGISGQLTHLYVIFDMKGIAVKVLAWNNKIRVKI